MRWEPKDKLLISSSQIDKWFMIFKEEVRTRVSFVFFKIIFWYQIFGKFTHPPKIVKLVEFTLEKQMKNQQNLLGKGLVREHEDKTDEIPAIEPTE